MALPAPVVENVFQTQINTPLGMGREANYIKLTDYYSTNKKDIYE